MTYTSKLSLAHPSHLEGLPSLHTHNEIRPSDERFRSIYASGFETWADLYSAASTKRKLPRNYLSPQEAFPHHPSLPTIGSVEYDKFEAFITATSLWGSGVSSCKHELPSFERPVQIGVATKSPILLSVSDIAQDNINCSLWFISDDDYLIILILAWTYILSARWAELMRTTCSVEYTHALEAHCDTLNEPKADYNESNTVYIDIDYADPDEARWWSAILLSGQGWRATMRLAKATFLSPWSTDFQSDLRFLLSPPSQPSVSPSNPTFLTACGYLTRFCTRHNITDQSYAALAAALLLPSVGDGRILHLLPPRISKSKLSRSLREEFSWTRPIHCSDRLLMLNCNIRGIRPALLSVFHEADVECNTVTPWLQGTLSAIKTLAKTDACIIGRMCMDRKPEVAYLWLGATVLGLQERLLQDVWRGQIQFDLESAAWSETLQSFIQQPVSSPLVVQEHIRRADECRLLFLSRSDHYVRHPVCQWKPFGVTPVEDVDIEVRVHCNCGERAPVSYEALDRDRKIIFENTTRSILGWLRSDGWTRDEKETLQHPWFDMSDSDEEDEEEVQPASDDGRQGLLVVRSWLDDYQTSIQ